MEDDEQVLQPLACMDAIDCGNEPQLRLLERSADDRQADLAEAHRHHRDAACALRHEPSGVSILR